MKVNTYTWFFMVSILIVTGSASAQVNKLRNDEIEIVDLCEVLDKQALYEGKTLRIVGIFAYGGEDFNVLYCPKCVNNGVLRPILTNSYRTNTKRKFRNMLSREKKSSGSVKIVAVGTFSRQQFLIDRVENAEFISKEFALPDKLSSSVVERITCEANR